MKGNEGLFTGSSTPPPFLRKKRTKHRIGESRIDIEHIPARVTLFYVKFKASQAQSRAREFRWCSYLLGTWEGVPRAAIQSWPRKHVYAHAAHKA